MISIYTGDNLVKFVMNKGVSDLNKRYFVADIVGYCRGYDNVVMLINGVKGTGKFTGMLQAIDSLNRYQCAVFIDIKEKIQSHEMMQLLIDYDDNKYIFINNVENISELEDFCEAVYKEYASRGIKVILSSNLSTLIVTLFEGVLRNKSKMLNVTYSSYQEIKDITGATLDEYYEYGIKTAEDCGKYILDNIVNNIVNSMYCIENKDLAVIDKLSKEEFESLVSNILTGIAYENNTSGDYCIYNFVRKQHEKARCVLNMLVKIGIVARIRKLGKEYGYKYFISHSGIENAVCKEIIDDDIRNNQFYNIIASYVYYVAEKKGYDVYYHDLGNYSGYSLIVEKHIERPYDKGIVKYVNISVVSSFNRAGWLKTVDNDRVSCERVESLTVLNRESLIEEFISTLEEKLSVLD